MNNLVWAKTAQNTWHNLLAWDFSSIKSIGVYHIWCVGKSVNYNVRCGQGIIGARITVHKNDPQIVKHANSGTLYVTWAAVPSAQLDAVERFLADHYRPVEGDRYPDAPPLVVNLPGA